MFQSPSAIMQMISPLLTFAVLVDISLLWSTFPPPAEAANFPHRLKPRPAIDIFAISRRAIDLPSGCNPPSWSTFPPTPVARRVPPAAAICTSVDISATGRNAIDLPAAAIRHFGRHFASASSIFGFPTLLNPLTGAEIPNPEKPGGKIATRGCGGIKSKSPLGGLSVLTSRFWWAG